METILRWLMEFVIESREYFSSLVYFNPEEGVDSLPSGFNHEEIVEGLVDLFDQGLILANDPSNIQDQGFIPSREKIWISLRDETRLTYGLTSRGGNVLESVAKINWNKYFYSFSFDWNNIEAISINRKLLESYLMLPCFLDVSVLVPNSQVWDIIQNWNATYWKTFPSAHRVCYQCKSIPISDNTVFAYTQECMSIATNWARDNANWYEPVLLSSSSYHQEV